MASTFPNRVSGGDLYSHTRAEYFYELQAHKVRLEAKQYQVKHVRACVIPDCAQFLIQQEWEWFSRDINNYYNLPAI